MSENHIVERCSCGAEFECTGTLAALYAKRWRESHRHVIPTPEQRPR